MASQIQVSRVTIHNESINQDTLYYLECPSSCYVSINISIPPNTDTQTISNLISKQEPDCFVVGILIYEKNITFFRIPKCVVVNLIHQGITQFVPYTSNQTLDSKKFTLKSGLDQPQHVCNDIIDLVI